MSFKISSCAEYIQGESIALSQLFSLQDKLSDQVLITVKKMPKNEKKEKDKEHILPPPKRLVPTQMTQNPKKIQEKENQDNCCVSSSLL